MGHMGNSPGRLYEQVLQMGDQPLFMKSAGMWSHLWSFFQNCENGETISFTVLLH